MPPQNAMSSACAKEDSFEPESWMPSNRDGIQLNAKRWLSIKRKDDDIGEKGVWRIHDELYDLSEFADRHPGGAQWIRLTEGTDITEAFEVAHVFKGVDKSFDQILEKYHVGSCKEVPRRSPFTFKPDDFYQTLKRRAQKVLKEAGGSGPTWQMTLLIDSLVILFHALLIVTITSGSTAMAVITGIVLGWTTTMSHNFFHQRDSFRRYYWDMSMTSSTDWRVTHMLSHHLHTNTFNDFEIAAFNPLLEWLPDANMSIFSKYISPVVYHIIFFVAFPLEYVKKCIGGITGSAFFSAKEDLFPLIHLAFFLVFSPISPEKCVILWLLMHAMAGHWLAFTTIISTHHHPSIYHAGDYPYPSTDFGLRQMDSVRDVDKGPSLFWLAATLGDHLLHHLFPTVDQSKLGLLYPVFKKTCEEFGTDYEFEEQWEMFKGMHRQIARSTPLTYENRRAMRKT